VLTLSNGSGRAAAVLGGKSGSINYGLMQIVIEIKLACDGEETILARDERHVTNISNAQTMLANRVANSALELLSGEVVLTKPLERHLVD